MDKKGTAREIGINVKENNTTVSIHIKGNTSSIITCFGLSLIARWALKVRILGWDGISKGPEKNYLNQWMVELFAG